MVYVIEVFYQNLRIFKLIKSRNVMKKIVNKLINISMWDLELSGESMKRGSLWH